MALLKEIFSNKIEVYAFVGPSGTGKSYRAQMVAGEKDVHFIIDDGLFLIVELKAHFACTHIDRECGHLLIFKVADNVRIDIALFRRTATKQHTNHQKQRNRNAKIDQQAFHFVSIVQVIHSFTEGRSAAVHLRL